jgi:drug/metabolite transporter (DMT)-like permease
LFGCGGIVYTFLLRRVPLNIAQVFAAAQFVGVVIAASLVLGEPISPARWRGIACISFGRGGPEARDHRSWLVR